MKAKHFPTAFLLLSICIAASGCGPGQFLGSAIVPTATSTAIPTATNTAGPTVTPTPLPTSTKAPFVVDVSQTFASKLYPVSVNYPAGWGASEDKWQSQDHTTAITLASPDGDATFGHAIIYMMAQALGQSADIADSTLMGTTDAFGEAWLGQGVFRQTERTHIITRNGGKFAIASYDGKAADTVPLVVGTFVKGGSLAVVWGSAPFETLADFRALFEEVLVSIQFK